MTTIIDDRTQEEKKTHTCLIVMTDRCLSGWGLAEGGSSYAGWACKPENDGQVFGWVESRSDSMRVRYVSSDYKPNSRYCKHFHIYVVRNGHPAIN